MKDFENFVSSLWNSFGLFVESFVLFFGILR